MSRTSTDPDNKRAEDAAAQTSAFGSIAIVGLGLIGASLAGAIKKRHPDLTLIGVDSDSRTRVVAAERAWVDEVLAPDDGALAARLSSDVDLVVIATPVSAVDFYLNLLKDAGYTGVITDTISTKSHILDIADTLIEHPERYIPGHPMAGSETNGIDGARTDLFEGSNWILCPDEGTDPESFKDLHELICSLDARIVSIPREDHDKAVAIVSHVPHMIASSLVELAHRHSDDTGAIMRLAAGGFKDTTRIAAGSPELWCGIAFDNASAIRSGLSEMQQIIGDFSRALDEHDERAFTDMLASAAAIRRSLPSAWVPGSDKLLEVRIPMIDRKGVVAEVTTIASSVGCNIQSIEIDHLSEGNAVLVLILTDEGDVGQLSFQLIQAGYTVSFSPLNA